MDMAKPKIRFKGYTDDWEQRKLDDWGDFYYGRSCPKWSVTENATIPCIRYGELYTKFGAKIDRVYSYTNMPPENLRFSKGTEVLIPRVGEDPMDYNHCTWLSMPDIAIGEMISVFNTDNNPLFTATMFNATLQNDFAMRVEGGSVTNLYFEKLKNIEVSFPSILEQEKIAAYFEDLDHLITLHQRKCEETKKLKKYMLQKMFPQNGQTVPEIRFAGFTDAWEQRKLNEIADKVTEKNKNNKFSEPFTNSAEQGIISQKDYFDREIVNDENLNGYYIVRKDDFIYNPRISVTAPVGPINRNRLGRNGVISPLYTVFRTHDIDNLYLEFYFKTTKWHRFMKLNGDSGARFDRFTISSTQFMEMPIPYPTLEEQRKIGAYFESLDTLITLHQHKYEQLQSMKKFMLQNMFV